MKGIVLLIAFFYYSISSYSQPINRKSMAIKGGFITAVMNVDSVVGLYEMFENYNAKYNSFERVMYFSFSGKRINDTLFSVKILSNDRVIEGVFIIKDSSYVYLQCKDDEPYGYATFSFIDDGYKSTFSRISLESIKVIGLNRATIYSKPNSSYKTKMYLERGDFVKVHNITGEWCRIAYFNYYKNKIIYGYIKSNSCR